MASPQLGELGTGSKPNLAQPEGAAFGPYLLGFLIESPLQVIEWHRVEISTEERTKLKANQSLTRALTVQNHV